MRRFIASCPPNGTVLPRYCNDWKVIPSQIDCSPAAAALERGAVRRYSVTRHSFPMGHGLPQCSTLAELLAAERHGRRFDATRPSQPAQEAAPSIFVPHGCSIALPTPDEAARLLQRCKLILIGDSEVRHLYQGVLLLAARSSLVNASLLPIGARLPSTVPAFESLDSRFCECDGQFSSHTLCRNLYRRLSPHAAYAERGMHGNVEHLRNLSSVPCDERPWVVWLQGGLHYDSDAELALRRFFVPALELVASRRRECGLPGPQALTLAGGLLAQSRSLDAVYPRQTRESAAVFNKRVASVLHESAPNFAWIDGLALTADAQTADGVHYLTDVALARAAMLWSAINMTLGGYG